MSNTLAYASPGRDKRWSKLALIALLCAVVAPPFFFLANALSAGTSSSSTQFIILLITFVMPPMIAFLIGLSSLTRILVARGRLRGMPFALLAMAGAIAWPVWAIWWLITHFSCC